MELIWSFHLSFWTCYPKSFSCTVLLYFSMLSSSCVTYVYCTFDFSFNLIQAFIRLYIYFVFSLQGICACGVSVMQQQKYQQAVFKEEHFSKMSENMSHLRGFVHEVYSNCVFFYGARVPRTKKFTFHNTFVNVLRKHYYVLSFVK